MSDIKEQTTENAQEQEILKMGFEQIKTMYSMQLERLKSADEKLNMVLVFNGAILALLLAVLPFDSSNKVGFILSIIFFTCFILSMVLTIISVFIGLFPTKVHHISTSDYDNPSTYHCSIEQYIGKYICGYKDSIESIQKTVEKKHLMNKHAMILTLINIVFIVALIIIKII